MSSFLSEIYRNYKIKIDESANIILSAEVVEGEHFEKISSNLKYFKTDFVIKEEFPDVPMEVLATYHSDYVSDINNFFEKIDFLEKTKTVRTHLMLEEKNIELIKDIYMSRKNRYNTSDLSGVDVVPIHSFEKNRAFHDIDWFDKNKRHFGYLENEVDSSCVVPLVDGYKDNRYFKGMLCTGENIVDPNGDVYHCYQDVISKRVKLNLCERNLKKQQDVKICLNTQCNDGFFFPKYSVKHYNNRG